MDLQQLKRVIEAILLAAAQPLSLAQLAALFTEEEAVTGEQLLEALQALAEDCAGRGIELKEVASGYRYQIREDVHAWVTRLWTERQTKYSRALLETLALIAYRQPITRAEIEQIRGVAVSSSIIKTLEEREWVRVVGYRDVPGRPALFGTSRSFLDYFNLKSLDELPPLAEIRDLDEYDPQLDLAPVIPPSLELPPEDDGEAAAEAATADEPAVAAAAPDLAAGETDTGALPHDAETEADGGTDMIANAGAPAETAAPVAEHAAVADTTAAPAPADDAVTPADAFDAGADEGAEIRGGDDAADADAADLDDIEAEADDGSDEYAAETDGRWSDADDLTESHFPPDDDVVDPNDTTTSDDVPEHTA